MRPLLRMWCAREAGRERAAPHVKTYGRVVRHDCRRHGDRLHDTVEEGMLTNNETPNTTTAEELAQDQQKHVEESSPQWSFDWFLLTSANLSKPAWGTPSSKGSHHHIRSYEAGVLIHPELYGPDTVLVPTWKSDVPSAEQVEWACRRGYKRIVGVRMAWDLPLRGYEGGDVPWVRSRGYEGRDWLGREWRGG